jgi:L-rhamnose isomerase / sugar isomerase
LAHQLLSDAFRLDVRPLLVRVREELGAPADPLAAYRASGYEARIAEQRGVKSTSGGFQ